MHRTLVCSSKAVDLNYIGSLPQVLYTSHFIDYGNIIVHLLKIGYEIFFDLTVRDGSSSGRGLRS